MDTLGAILWYPNTTLLMPAAAISAKWDNKEETSLYHLLHKTSLHSLVVRWATPRDPNLANKQTGNDRESNKGTFMMNTMSRPTT